MRCSQCADLCINEMCAAVHWADKGSHRGLGPGENKWSKWTKVIRGKKKKEKKKDTEMQLGEKSEPTEPDCAFHLWVSSSSMPTHKGIAKETSQQTHFSLYTDKRPWNSPGSSPFILTASCTVDTTSVSENTPPTNYWDNIKSLSLALETTFVECMLSSNATWEEDRWDWMANTFSMTSTDNISPSPWR